ncbi:hypothetical protein LCGC14_0971800 [marine sediment metagenome]|uniref:Asparagine synthetase domain-containing protein n=1 Tax=marine sediment metagenome TaxID=412755 RepID=A0A0F9NBI5_9ZZZZ
MESKEKIGIFLSGGLDSRLIAGFASKIAKKNDKELISFTFGTKGGRQEKIAKRIAKILNIENIFYEIPVDSIANIPIIFCLNEFFSLIRILEKSKRFLSAIAILNSTSICEMFFLCP